MASITIQIPDQEALEYDLDGIEQLTIGRGPDNDVVLEHVSMSGSHATIRNLDGAFQLTDLGSTNGTFVDGSPVQEVTLASGAQIRFGGVDAVFSDGEVAAGPEEGASEATGTGEAETPSAHAAEMAEVSHRPADFKDLSPIEKVVKKDTISQIAILIAVVGILAAIALVAISYTMQAA